MKKRKFIFLFSLLLILFFKGFAQPDSAEERLNTTGMTDEQPSFAEKSINPEESRTDFLETLLQNNTYLSDKTASEAEFVKLRPHGGKEKNRLFYILTGTILLLALIRITYGKYFKELFEAFYAPSLNNRHLKDNLRQITFPSFTLNLFFIISFALFLYIALFNQNLLNTYSPTLLIPLFIFFFCILYLSKFFILRFLGWLLGLRPLMKDYTFTLFLVNRITGILLLPFILVMALSTGILSKLALYGGLLVLFGLLIYRYSKIFGHIQRSIRISKFHFFIYICTLEIAPVLILGKMMMIWLA